MAETDLQLGGGYTYQWECAILLALNYFFEPVRYNPTLDDLVTGFLGRVEAIHLEGEDRQSGVDLEDINLTGGKRRILVQGKTKQAEGKLWTPTDDLLLKALYRFYNSRFLAEQPVDIRFVFLTNRPFNPDLVKIKDAIQAGMLDNCLEANRLCEYLDRYAQAEKGRSLELDRFRQMLARAALVEYLAVDTVKANVQAKLQAYGRRDWQQAHAVLFEHFARQSTRIGGGTVTQESIVQVLGPYVRSEPAAGPTIFAQQGQIVGTQINIAGDVYGPLPGVPAPGASLPAVDVAGLRVRLQRLDAVEIESLCLDHFPEVYDKFGRGLRRDEMINLLLDHCRRNPGDAARLAALLK